MKSPIHFIAPFSNSVAWIANFLGGGKFLPSNFILDIMADMVGDRAMTDEIYSTVVFLLCGFDNAQLNKTMLETITKYTPAGTSTNTVVHYAQEVNSKKFAHFDYGKEGNLEKYNSEDPPEYSVEALTIPVTTYWSQNDWLAQPQDVLKYLTALPNSYNVFKVPFESWNHLDYFWGIDAKTLLYPEIIKNIDDFNSMIFYRD